MEPGPTVTDGPAYEFSVEVPLDAAAAGARVRDLLREEGFGVLTEIDVRETMRRRLDVEFRPYTILGACNPSLAHRALVAEPGVGVLLPCNVVVEEAGPGRSRIRFMEPLAALSLVGGGAVEEVAREASERLHRVAGRLAA